MRKWPLLGLDGQLALVTLSRKLATGWGSERAIFTKQHKGLDLRKAVRGSPVPGGKWWTAESALEPSLAPLALEKELPVTAESLACDDSAIAEGEMIRRINCGVFLQDGRSGTRRNPQGFFTGLGKKS